MNTKTSMSAASVGAPNVYTTPVQTPEQYAKDIGEYWNDADLADQLGRMLSMYDLIVEAKERLTADQLDEVCRDLVWTPRHFERFAQIGALHQENEKDKGGFRILMEQHYVAPDDSSAAGDKVSDYLRSLIICHIRSCIKARGGFGVGYTTKRETEYFSGLRFIGTELTGKRHYKVSFEMNQSLRDELTLTSNCSGEVSVFVELWPSGYWSASLTVERDVAKYLSRAELDSASTAHLAALAASENEAVISHLNSTVTKTSLSLI